jgi:hypothetical protein
MLIVMWHPSNKNNESTVCLRVIALYRCSKILFAPDDYNTESYK